MTRRTWISSIRKINATVSVANSIALVDTSKGCTTFSSRIFDMIPLWEVSDPDHLKTLSVPSSR